VTFFLYDFARPDLKEQRILSKRVEGTIVARTTSAENCQPIGSRPTRPGGSGRRSSAKEPISLETPIDEEDSRYSAKSRPTRKLAKGAMRRLR
jgi:hypothetical protein